MVPNPIALVARNRAAAQDRAMTYDEGLAELEWARSIDSAARRGHLMRACELLSATGAAPTLEDAKRELARLS